MVCIARERRMIEVLLPASFMDNATATTQRDTDGKVYLAPEQSFITRKTVQKPLTANNSKTFNWKTTITIFPITFPAFQKPPTEMFTVTCMHANHAMTQIPQAIPSQNSIVTFILGTHNYWQLLQKSTPAFSLCLRESGHIGIIGSSLQGQTVAQQLTQLTDYVSLLPFLGSFETAGT